MRGGAGSGGSGDSSARRGREPRRPLALVTGGARRLGRRLALALARDGYDVAISYHGSAPAADQVARELRAAGAAPTLLRVDLRDAGVVPELVARVERDAGPIDLLVNNAGVFPGGDPLVADPRAFDEAIAVNLRAPYLLGVAFGRAMRERGHGAIVNIASVGGLRPYVHHIPYSVSKAGLVMLTRALAIALAPHVRVNAVAPGTIWLEGEEEGAAAKPRSEEIPLRRYGGPEDVEQAVLYLARAAFVTGEVLVVDGGSSIRFQHP